MKTIAERIKLNNQYQLDLGLKYEHFVEDYKEELDTLSVEIVDYFSGMNRVKHTGMVFMLQSFAGLTLMSDMDMTKCLIWYLCDQGMTVHKMSNGEHCKLCIGLGQY